MSANTISSNNYIWRFSLKDRILIEQLLMLCQFFNLGLFFVEILKKSKFLKSVKVLFLLSIILQILLIAVVHLSNIEIRQTIVPNLFLTIFCFYYLRDLMKNKPTLILGKSSTFWIVMGIFFSSCIGFPIGSLIPFIPKDEEYINFRNQIFSISNLSLIILYLFIIKSYLCLKHPQNL